ncbi:MAG: peptide chain release factor N(5)-glutamine methyltransferase [Maricaulaceae bacterium]
MTLGELRRAIRQQLKQANVETPDLDARILLCESLDCGRADLILNQELPISGQDTNHTLLLCARRAAGEPIDHILGYREFYGRRFTVNAHVLSPRPETELLVEKALGTLQNKAANILELGAGSGALAITLALENPKLSLTATDISEAALKVARENAKRHNTDNRVTFLCGDWFAPVPQTHFDLIISNPPYIDGQAMALLSPEVKNFDPDLALYGGEDGLAAYRHIAAHCAGYLTPKGWLMLEIGYDQGASVSTLLKDHGFQSISVGKDLSGHNRIISAQHP